MTKLKQPALLRTNLLRSHEAEGLWDLGNSGGQPRGQASSNKSRCGLWEWRCGTAPRQTLEPFLLLQGGLYFTISPNWLLATMFTSSGSSLLWSMVPLGYCSFKM